MLVMLDKMPKFGRYARQNAQLCSLCRTKCSKMCSLCSTKCPITLVLLDKKPNYARYARQNAPLCHLVLVLFNMYLASNSNFVLKNVGTVLKLLKAPILYQRVVSIMEISVSLTHSLAHSLICADYRIRVLFGAISTESEAYR